MPKQLSIELDAETQNQLGQLARQQNQTLEECAQDALRDWTNTVGQARIEYYEEAAATSA